MAGQGSINMPAPGRSPIEGIMQALQAVHQYYGIDTEKQQQALMATQAEAAARDLKAEKDFDSGKNPSRTFALKNNLVFQPGSGQSNKADDPATQTPSFQDTMSGAPASPQTISPSAKQNAPLPYGAIPATDANGLSGYYRNLGAETKLSEADLKKQDAVNAKLTTTQKQNENSTFGTKLVTEADKDFQTFATDEIKADKYSKQVNQLLSQGSPITGKFALVAITKMSDDLNRVQTNSGVDMTRPIGMLAQLKEGLTEGAEQNISPEKRAQLREVAKVLSQVNSSTLDDKAGHIAASHYNPTMGFRSPDELKAKLLTNLNSPPPKEPPPENNDNSGANGGFDLKAAAQKEIARRAQIKGAK